MHTFVSFLFVCAHVCLFFGECAYVHLCVCVCVCVCEREREREREGGRGREGGREEGREGGREGERESHNSIIIDHVTHCVPHHLHAYPITLTSAFFLYSRDSPSQCCTQSTWSSNLPQSETIAITPTQQDTESHKHHTVTSYVTTIMQTFTIISANAFGDCRIGKRDVSH